MDKDDLITPPPESFLKVAAQIESALHDPNTRQVVFYALMKDGEFRQSACADPAMLALASVAAAKRAAGFV